MFVSHVPSVSIVVWSVAVLCLCRNLVFLHRHYGTASPGTVLRPLRVPLTAL